MSSHDKHHSLVRSQYNLESGTPFYRQVMGDGSPVIHYGIYESSETSMRQATENSSMRLLEIALQYLSSDKLNHIIDLGSGPGGSAHFLAQQTQARITCVDLCDHHHQENIEIASSLGISDQMETWMGSFENLPHDWTERFDLAWSQEAFCHSADKLAAFQEAHRVLRRGGMLVFSDILLVEDTPSEASSVYSRVNAVARWTTVNQHIEDLTKAGFIEITFHDWTPHLAENFQRMLLQIKTHQGSLHKAGVPNDMLERFSESLKQRLRWLPGTVLRWGAFSCIAPRSTSINTPY
jgi:cyclopropane fatty-acyl-phospholipid synthase-like methyltransferase